MSLVLDPAQAEKTFDLEHLSVGANRSWVLSVRERQITLGSCVISAKRRVERMSDLSRWEALELRKMFRAFELLLTACFQPDTFNYVVSGQSNLDDPFLHFHAFPRYSEARHWRHHDWSDVRWPRFLSFPEIPVNSNLELRSLADLLRKEAEAKGLLATE